MYLQLSSDDPGDEHQILRGFFLVIQFYFKSYETDIRLALLLKTHSLTFSLNFSSSFLNRQQCIFEMIISPTEKQLKVSKKSLDVTQG